MKVKSVKIIKSLIIKNNKGDILKYLNKKSKYFNTFGEIYFSEIKKNCVKGWNMHKFNTCIITVPIGKIVFKYLDYSKNKIVEILLGKKNYKLLVITPGTWFCFKSLTKLSIVANFMDNTHSKKDSYKSKIINGIEID